MVPKCIGALLARNEAGSDRYLRRALDNAALFCDEIVVLDDNSTDKTAEICRAHPKVTVVEATDALGGWWDAGTEVLARQRLWKLAAEKVGPDGWIYFFDADHELLGITPEQFRGLLGAEVVNAWSCVLWDAWDSDRQHRVDGYWQAWRRPRPWLVRAYPTPGYEAVWGNLDAMRGLHAGHIPASYPFQYGIMPEGSGILHLGYVSSAHRAKKVKRYRIKEAHLEPAQLAHAESITDTTVTIAPIPPVAVPRILVGSVIRKPPEVLRALFKTLAWQRFRRPVDLSYYFITDFAPSDTYAAASIKELSLFSTSVKSATFRQAGNNGGDFSEVGPSHQWSPQAWHRVGALKNEIIQKALTENFDALWLIDADVLCDPTTLQSLLDTESPVVAGVYWTQWMRQSPEAAQVIHAAPQVWMRHPYKLDGNGYTEAEFREALIERSLIRVGGLGACTLFHRNALAKGVNFVPVPDGLPPGPMSDGEDRHLCERARRLHLPLFADAWPDIYHAYHAAEYGSIDEWLARLNRAKLERPSVGDLVSFKLEMNEPIPRPDNPQLWQYVGPQYGRGRLGTLGLLPELEEALASMAVGDKRVLHVHFPAHYEYPTLRGQSRVVTVSLFDAKPFGLPPVVDRELLRGERSGAVKDATTMTERQLVKMTS